MVLKWREAKHRAKSGVLAVAQALYLAGCGAGASAPAYLAPADSASTVDGNAAGAPATFTAVYTEVLGPTCRTCHQPGGIGSFQDFSSQAVAYGALVGVKASGPSCGSSGQTRVVPGNASGSLLYQKVSESSPPCGAMMPLGGPPLTSAQVTLIEDWIKSGAQND